MRDPSADIQAAAANVGEPLSAAAYTAWRSQQPPGPLSAWTISRRGGWPAACERAGVIAAGATYRRWTRDDHLEAVRAAARSTSGPLTATAYRKWRATQAGPLPELTGYSAPEWAELLRQADVDGGGSLRR